MEKVRRDHVGAVAEMESKFSQKKKLHEEER